MRASKNPSSASGRASPRAMSIRSGASTPPSSIALNDAASVADSERDFFRNVQDEGNMDRHIETFLLNEAAKGREESTPGSPSPSLSSAFSPASAARTPLMSNQKGMNIPEMGLGASAYTAPPSSAGSRSWDGFGPLRPSHPGSGPGPDLPHFTSFPRGFRSWARVRVRGGCRICYISVL